MTLPMSQEAPAAWRQAHKSDLAAIVRLAGLVHPLYPERPAVFADRLTLHPSGVMLAMRDQTTVGYAIGHPWRGPPPLLDHCLHVLPLQPDCYWVHDLALLPQARGCGLGRAALELLRADAGRSRLQPLRLVAVDKAKAFWQAAGFIPTAETLPSCYGATATGMRHGGIDSTEPVDRHGLDLVSITGGDER